MKTNAMKLTRTGLAALLGSLVTAGAIERPKGGKVEEGAPTPLPAEPQGGILRDDQKPAEKRDKAIEKVAFLGVGGDAVDAALKHQLELKNGLLLKHIAPNSPAAFAGLAEHDIVISLDEILLTDQDSLRDALKDFKPGDEVELKLVRRGQEINQKVVLGESQAAPNAQAFIPEPARDLNQLLNKKLGAQLEGIDNEQMRKQMLEELERAIGPGFKELRFGFDGGNFLDGGDKKLGFKSAATVHLKDKDGSIEMKTDNGQKQLTIRDNDGKILFDGPYDTEIDKEAVPEEYRERVERLTGRGGGFQLKFGGLRQNPEGKNEE